MKITNKPVIAIPSFVEYFKTISEFEDIMVKNDIEKTGLFLFRGQERDYDLLPKLGRPEFLKYNIIDKEKQIIDEFRRLSYPYLNLNSQLNAWDILALARHHNLPTRLLDWTSNPLAALWFSFNKEKQDTSERVVWLFAVSHKEIVSSKEEFQFDQSKTLIFKPNHITKRITAQDGWFTVHYFGERDLFRWDKVPGKDEKRLKDLLIKNYGIDWSETAIFEKSEDHMTINVSNENKKLSLSLNDKEVKLVIDDGKTDKFYLKKGELKIYHKKIKKIIPLNHNTKFEGRLIKFLIPEDQRNDIMRKLDRLNINHFSLFPDLEGLGNYLEWKNFKKNR